MDLALAISLRPKDAAFGDPEVLAELDGDEVRDAVLGALSLLGPVRLWDTTTLTPAQIASQEKPDLIFNMSEGLRGSAREAQAPALFEWLGWRYTGSDPVTLAIALDKWYTKSLLRAAGIPTARARLACHPLRAGFPDLTFPLVLKPVAEGSGIGVHLSGVVETEQQLIAGAESHLSRYRQPVLVEEYLEGREFTVAAIGNRGRWRVLPIVEVNLPEATARRYPMFDYEAKWVHSSPSEVSCPASIPAPLRATLEAATLATCDALRVRDWARVDFRLDREGTPRVLEVNPLPGILPGFAPGDISSFTLAAYTAGLDYRGLIHELVQIALERYRSEPLPQE